jgi:hypothetical protein
LKTITRTNAVLSGYWTAADTVRALGPLNGGAGIPFAFAKAAMVPAEERILTTLDTLKVLITDIFGAPVSGIAVNYRINSRPTPLSGGSLTDTSVTTNASGIASTVFTLGSKVGSYEVIAAAVNSRHHPVLHTSHVTAYRNRWRHSRCRYRRDRSCHLWILSSRSPSQISAGILWIVQT